MGMCARSSRRAGRNLRVRSGHRVRYGVAARALKYESINPAAISWLYSGKIHADFAADAVGDRDVLITGMRVGLLRHARAPSAVQAGAQLVSQPPTPDDLWPVIQLLFG